MSEDFTTPEGYTKFVTRLGSKYSMADFNAKLGTLGLGLGGEAGEVANLVSQLFIDDEDDLPESLRLKLVDELGDIMWYVAFGCGNVVEVPLKSLIDDGVKMQRSINPSFDLDMMYAPLMAECGEVTDTVKKLLFHGKPFDQKAKDRMVSAMREIVESVQMIAQAVCAVTLDDVIKKNVEKLSERYKGLQFTTEEFLKKEAAKEVVPETGTTP